MSNVTHQESNGDAPYLVIDPMDNKRISALAYTPDGRLVSGSMGGSVKIWNVKTGEQEGTSMEHRGDVGVRELAATKDGKRIIGSDEVGCIRVWDVESHKLVKKWTCRGTSPTLAISPDDQRVAVGGEKAKIYTLEGRRIGRSIDVSTFSVCFSSGGKKLACANWDSINVYDVTTGTPILGPLQGHTDLIRGLVWSHDGTRIFSGSSDKTIRCWDANTGEQIGPAWSGHTDWIEPYVFGMQRMAVSFDDIHNIPKWSGWFVSLPLASS
ncbi:WD40-repeat-containing domain protein [Chiua virens]|nr:WD40-repeat-containing domain protein [Chiua virens]